MSDMVARADIQEFVDRVVARFQPEQVILFGSYAYGEPTEDSDVDLLVVMPRDKNKVRPEVRIRLACRRRFSMDLLVHSRDELNYFVDQGEPFFIEIVKRGIKLHEADYASMDR